MMSGSPTSSRASSAAHAASAGPMSGRTSIQTRCRPAPSAIVESKARWVRSSIARDAAPVRAPVRYFVPGVVRAAAGKTRIGWPRLAFPMGRLVVLGRERSAIWMQTARRNSASSVICRARSVIVVAYRAMASIGNDITNLSTLRRPQPFA
jgi:hypothetical protein